MQGVTVGMISQTWAVISRMKLMPGVSKMPVGALITKTCAHMVPSKPTLGAVPKMGLHVMSGLVILMAIANILAKQKICL